MDRRVGVVGDGVKHKHKGAGELLAALRTMFPNSSGSTLRKMLTQGRVVLNGKVVHRAKHELTDGDTIEVLERQRAEIRTPPPKSTPSVDLDVLLRCWWSTNHPNSCPLPRIGWKLIRSTVAASSTYVNPVPRRGASSCTGLTKRRPESWFLPSTSRPKKTFSNNFTTGTFTAPIVRWWRDNLRHQRARCEAG